MKNRLLTIELRNKLGIMASNLHLDKGWSIQEICNHFEMMDISVPRRTLARWVTNSISEGVAVPIGCGLGRLSVMEDWQKESVAGFVLYKNERKEIVHALTVVQYVKIAFDIYICETTAQNYLKELGFSSREMKLRDGVFLMSTDSMVDAYYEWLLHLSIDVEPHLLCSVDCTFTSHRSRRPVGYSRKGGVSPELAKLTPRYTNCIVTCVWADGVVRTPCMLFTFDPAFRRDRNSTDIRDGKMESFFSACENYQIDPDRIVYVGKAVGETRTYCSESPDVLRQFFAHHSDRGGNETVSWTELTGCLVSKKSPVSSLDCPVLLSLVSREACSEGTCGELLRPFFTVWTGAKTSTNRFLVENKKKKILFLSIGGCAPKKKKKKKKKNLTKTYV